LAAEEDEMDSEQTSTVHPSYRSYLLRLWWADNAGRPVCRASLEEPGSYTQIHFENLVALGVWLAAQVGITHTDKQAGEQQNKEI
jgi:hypothetical protein